MISSFFFFAGAAESLPPLPPNLPPPLLYVSNIYNSTINVPILAIVKYQRLRLGKVMRDYYGVKHQGIYEQIRAEKFTSGSHHTIFVTHCLPP